MLPNGTKASKFHSVARFLTLFLLSFAFIPSSLPPLLTVRFMLLNTSIGQPKKKKTFSFKCTYMLIFST
jgi:hypothetical protein